MLDFYIFLWTSRFMYIALSNSSIHKSGFLKKTLQYNIRCPRDMQHGWQHLLASSSESTIVGNDYLQEHVNSLSDYFKSLKIIINPDETQSLYFTRCYDIRKHLDKRLIFASHTTKSIQKLEKSFLNQRLKLNWLRSTYCVETQHISSATHKEKASIHSK
jgi:hypothetical protein